MRAMAAAEIALLCRQRIDVGGQQNGPVVSLGAANGNASDNITDSEIISYINLEVASLHRMLLSKAPSNYGFAIYNVPIQAGVSLYPMPFDFKAALGVNIALDNSGSNFISIKPFNEHERNMYAYVPASGSYSYLPYTSSRYQIQDNGAIRSMQFIPNIGPGPGQIQVRYQRAAPTLCLTLPVLAAINHAQVVGDLVYAPVTLTNGTLTNMVFVALTAGTTGGTAPTWPTPGTVLDGTVLWACKGPLSCFQTEYDGINGWEAIIISRVCEHMGGKQERDNSDLMQLEQRLLEELEADTGNYQAADPQCVSGGWGEAEGGGRFGGGDGIGF